VLRFATAERCPIFVGQSKVQIEQGDLTEEMTMFRRGRPSAEQAYNLLREGYINAADIPPVGVPDSYEGRVAFERGLLSDQILDSVQEFMRREPITQQEVATRMGVSEGRVSQILSGEQNLTLKTLASLAAALGGRFRVSFEATNTHRVPATTQASTGTPQSARRAEGRVGSR
jgi:predicted XRE-type DNA-binding protein